MTIRQRDELLKKWKSQLLTRKETLLAEVKRDTEALMNDEQQFTDAVDMASAETEKSLALGKNNRDRQTLEQINAALGKIDAGTFGECVQCSELISDARLDAAPFTTLCIDCQAELESEKQRFPGRNS